MSMGLFPSHSAFQRSKRLVPSQPGARTTRNLDTNLTSDPWISFSLLIGNRGSSLSWGRGIRLSRGYGMGGRPVQLHPMTGRLVTILPPGLIAPLLRARTPSHLNDSGRTHRPGPSDDWTSMYQESVGHAFLDLSPIPSISEFCQEPNRVSAAGDLSDP